MKYSVLLVEDDESTALLVKHFLEECDFRVDISNSVTMAISNIKFEKYSVILLDINLPDFDGFEILKFLNKNKINIPAIVISAYSNKDLKLQAFKLGANDYMVKPIDPEELEARIWVQLKNSTCIIESIDKKLFELQDNSILFDNKNLKLTKIEFDILKLLIKNRNRIVQRYELHEFLSSSITSDRSLDYHIKNIRVKIGEPTANPKHLITEYGVGYKLIF